METTSYIQQLPFGLLSASQAEAIELSIPAKYINREAIADFFLLPHKISDENKHWIWPKLKHQHPINGNWVLEYTSKATGFIPLSEMIILWQQHLKIKFSAIVSFASEIASFYSKHGRRNLLLPCPFNIYCNRNSHNVDWFILAIPAFNFSFEEWAYAPPYILEWFPLELVKQKSEFPKYLQGIILQYCFAGNINNHLLSKREVFKRWLQNRQETSERLSKKITQALPENLQKEGRELAKQIEDSINYKNESDNVLDAYKLEMTFSSHRLATKWEYEDHLNIAIQILEDSHSNLFDVLARLYNKKGKDRKALSYQLKALKNGEEEILSTLLLQVLGIVKKDPRFRHESLFNELMKAINIEIIKKENSIYRLQLAYIKLRFFKELEQAKNLLIAGTEHVQYLDNWTRMLSNILRAYIFYKQEKFSTVSRLCEEGIILIENEHKYPQDSFPSEAQHRARMYFILLNGIAHISAVGKLKDYFYLNNAIPLITEALDAAIMLDEQDIVENAFQWLHFLKKLAILFPPQIGPVMKTGINAYIQTKERMGIIFPVARDQAPELPWFNENLFFPKIDQTWIT